MSDRLVGRQQIHTDHVDTLSAANLAIQAIESMDFKDVPSTELQKFKETLDTIKNRLERDIQNAEQDLSTVQADLNADNIEKLFLKWDKSPDLAPCAPALIAVHYGGTVDPQTMTRLMIAAILAEVPNKHTYHGNPHYRRVTAMGMFSHATINTIINALIHDYGHSGAHNSVYTVHIPAMIEIGSFAAIKPFFKEADYTDDELLDCRACLVATDCSGNPSPKMIVQEMYKIYLQGGAAALEDFDFDQVSPVIRDDLRRLRDNPALLKEAEHLCEIDVITSMGLSLDYNRIETQRLIDENPNAFMGHDKYEPWHINAANENTPDVYTNFNNLAKGFYGFVAGEVMIPMLHKLFFDNYNRNRQHVGLTAFSTRLVIH